MKGPSGDLEGGREQKADSSEHFECRGAEVRRARQHYDEQQFDEQHFDEHEQQHDAGNDSGGGGAGDDSDDDLEYTDAPFVPLGPGERYVPGVDQHTDEHGADEHAEEHGGYEHPYEHVEHFAPPQEGGSGEGQHKREGDEHPHQRAASPKLHAPAAAAPAAFTPPPRRPGSKAPPCPPPPPLYTGVGTIPPSSAPIASSSAPKAPAASSSAMRPPPVAFPTYTDMHARPSTSRPAPRAVSSSASSSSTSSSDLEVLPSKPAPKRSPPASRAGSTPYPSPQSLKAEAIYVPDSEEEEVARVGGGGRAPRRGEARAGAQGAREQAHRGRAQASEREGGAPMRSGGAAEHAEEEGADEQQQRAPPSPRPSLAGADAESDALAPDDDDEEEACAEGDEALEKSDDALEQAVGAALVRVKQEVLGYVGTRSPEGRTPGHEEADAEERTPEHEEEEHEEERTPTAQRTPPHSPLQAPAEEQKPEEQKPLIAAAPVHVPVARPRYRHALTPEQREASSDTAANRAREQRLAEVFATCGRARLRAAEGKPAGARAAEGGGSDAVLFRQRHALLRDACAPPKVRTSPPALEDAAHPHPLECALAAPKEEVPTPQRQHAPAQGGAVPFRTPQRSSDAASPLAAQQHAQQQQQYERKQQPPQPAFAVADPAARAQAHAA
ncbi:hypothetical protein JCM10449v2_005953 [Rhodotorula kratochvilovae]